MMFYDFFYFSMWGPTILILLNFIYFFFTSLKTLYVYLYLFWSFKVFLKSYYDIKKKQFFLVL